MSIPVERPIIDITGYMELVSENRHKNLSIRVNFLGKEMTLSIRAVEYASNPEKCWFDGKPRSIAVAYVGKLIEQRTSFVETKEGILGTEEVTKDEYRSIDVAVEKRDAFWELRVVGKTTDWRSHEH